MQKIKVLHILDELRYSGAEVMLKNSASLFVDKDVELYALGTGKILGVYSNKLKDAGLKFVIFLFEKQ